MLDKTILMAYNTFHTIHMILVGNTGGIYR